MSKQEEALIIKSLEGMQVYIRETWKDAVRLGVVKPSHNPFYEFLKGRISASLTLATNADELTKELA